MGERPVSGSRPGRELAVRASRTLPARALSATAHTANLAGHAAARVASAAGRRAWAGVSDALPRVPVRDLATLRAQHGGLEGEELADALVRGAAAAAATVGIAGGVAAFGSRKTPAWMIAIPATVASEAVLIAAIEAKLIAELHEVYGVPLRPGSRTRGGAVLAEWAARKDVDPLDPRSLRVLAGLAVRQRSTRAVAGTAGKAGRKAAMGTALVGGVAGASSHRRNLHELADELRADLRASRRNRINRGRWIF